VTTVPSLPALPTLVVQLAADADPVLVQTTQQDMLAWEETSHKHKWPGAADAPFLLSWFMGWHALRRTGGLPESMRTWELFRANAVGVGPAPDADGGGPATPTLPGPDPG
jgi:hypothetical protein